MKRAAWIGAALVGLAALGLVASSRMGREPAEAMTTTVAVTTEDGQQMERTVPKAEHRKSVVLFFQESEAEDLEWMRVGFPVLLATDLYQDPFLDLRIPFLFIEDLREKGHPDGLGVSRPIQRQITQDQHADYFVSGSVSRDEAGYLIRVTLNAVEGGEVASHEYHGEDPFALADAAALQLRRDLGTPPEMIETTEDLPVSDMVTSSTEAFREYIEGARLFGFAGDHAGARARVQAALAIDSTFAYAYYQDYLIATMLQDVAGARASLQKSLDYIYRVPERNQFKIRATYYADIQEDPEKTLAVLRMWETLYPEDLEAVKVLAYNLQFRGLKEEAAEKFQRALELDPESYDIVLHLGDLRRDTGAYDLAEARYRQYLGKFPQEVAGHQKLASLALIRGDLDSAEQHYEDALLNAPTDLDLRLNLVGLEVRRGNFADAQGAYDELLGEAKTPSQRRDVLGGLRRLARYRGQLHRSLEYLDLRLIETEKMGNPFVALGEQSGSMRYYVEAGETELALEKLRDARSRTAPEYGAVVSMGESIVYTMLGEADSAEVHVGHLRDFMERFGVAILEPVAVELEAGVAELRGDAARSATLYREALDSDPTDASLLQDLGRVLRKAGDLEGSVEILERALRVFPADGRARLELAKTFIDLGKPNEALEQLDRSLEIWAEADPEFAERIEARDLYETLKASS